MFDQSRSHANAAPNAGVPALLVSRRVRAMGMRMVPGQSRGDYYAAAALYDSCLLFGCRVTRRGLSRVTLARDVCQLTIPDRTANRLHSAFGDRQVVAAADHRDECPWLAIAAARSKWTDVGGFFRTGLTLAALHARVGDQQVHGSEAPCAPSSPTSPPIPAWKPSSKKADDGTGPALPRQRAGLPAVRRGAGPQGPDTVRDAGGLQGRRRHQGPTRRARTVAREVSQVSPSGHRQESPSRADRQAVEAARHSCVSDGKRYASAACNRLARIRQIARERVCRHPGRRTVTPRNPAPGGRGCA